MVRRHRDWKIGLAEDLEDPEFVQEFLVVLVEEHRSIQEALALVARTMGVKEFAAKVGMPSSNVLRAINRRHNPTLATLERMLRPWRVQLSLTKTPAPKARRSSRARRA